MANSIFTGLLVYELLVSNKSMTIKILNMILNIVNSAVLSVFTFRNMIFYKNVEGTIKTQIEALKPILEKQRK